MHLNIWVWLERKYGENNIFMTKRGNPKQPLGSILIPESIAADRQKSKENWFTVAFAIVNILVELRKEARGKTTQSSSTII